MRRTAVSARTDCFRALGWYVLTGGPSAGKTTLLDELARRGYRTIPEAARTYIAAEFKKGRTIEEIRADEVSFQYTILSLKRSNENCISPNELIFFDRGMHDTIAFLRAAGTKIDHKTATQIVGSSIYTKVFLLDMLPLVRDGVRTESAERARLIHSLLLEAYESHGISVVRVPVLPIGERAEFILRNI
jgi:predicted ATPase